MDCGGEEEEGTVRVSRALSDIQFVIMLHLGTQCANACVEPSAAPLQSRRSVQRLWVEDCAKLAIVRPSHEGALGRPSLEIQQAAAKHMGSPIDRSQYHQG